MGGCKVKELNLSNLIVENIGNLIQIYSIESYRDKLKPTDEIVYVDFKYRNNSVLIQDKDRYMLLVKDKYNNYLFKLIDKEVENYSISFKEGRLKLVELDFNSKKTRLIFI